MKTRAFSELQSYYLFAERFGRPAKGNDKGEIENLIGQGNLLATDGPPWENTSGGPIHVARKR
jgi:hypothetical protein